MIEIVSIYNYNSNVLAGCCKSEFDSTYPIRLNGIIGQNEFQQSIANINQAGSSSRIYLLILLVVFISVSVLGFVVTIVGVSVAVESDSVPFPVFLGVGMGLMVVGMLACSIGSCIIQSRVSAHVQKVVTEESAKYSTRIPPCSWRLNPLTFSSGYGRNQRTAVIYRVSIYTPLESTCLLALFGETIKMCRNSKPSFITDFS